MTYAELGPTLDPQQPDTVPVPIASWSILTDLTMSGHAMVTVTTPYHMGHAVIMVSVDPRTMTIAYSRLLLAGGESHPIAPRNVPGAVADLARTLTAERFPTYL